MLFPFLFSIKLPSAPKGQDSPSEIRVSVSWSLGWWRLIRKTRLEIMGFKYKGNPKSSWPWVSNFVTLWPLMCHVVIIFLIHIFAFAFYVMTLGFRQKPSLWLLNALNRSILENGRYIYKVFSYSWRSYFSFNPNMIDYNCKN